MVELYANISDQRILDTLREVSDPEIPVLSIMDMGIVRKISKQDNSILLDITPTYTGCPAMDTIAADIKTAIEGIGYECHVNLVLSPAWSTDWITEEGRKQLEDYGIAAPLDEGLDKRALMGGNKLVTCPRCQSTNTKVISEFGSTACKALFQCNDCLEPFDYFKCLK